ncbi:MAG: 3-isopropylmalate dehydratase small subunit [Buchnera aphidicola (Nurudea yanoniella)]
MSKFIFHTGIVAPLDISNIDTDAIIPKQFLQKVTKSGFGKNLFHNWRYLDDDGDVLNSDFILNKLYYKNSTILLSRENFGCGSSREHAVWALIDYGFKAIIASSFSDIFYSNSIKNHLLLIKLSKDIVDILFSIVAKHANTLVQIDLINNKVLVKHVCYTFEINSFDKHCILNGLDDVDLTMKYIKTIKKYENKVPKFFQIFK